MAQEIGIFDVKHLIHSGAEPGWFQEVRESLPEEIEVLNAKNGLDVLEFIENHKRLIVIDPDAPSGDDPMVYGEVAYWGQFTGGMPEEIIVLTTHSGKKEEIASEVLKQLNSIV